MKTKTLNKLVRQYTAFKSFDHLCVAPGYTPTLRIVDKRMAKLADAYDHAQRLLCSPRRASRHYPTAKISEKFRD